jgi:uncharacterized damage-inducible protein DinB
MPATAAEVLQEFELESMTTRRVLERVPTDQLTWKPHPKSRSLGQLALHVAIGPGLISQWALRDSMEMPDMGEPPQPTSNAQILAVHDDSVQKVKTAVSAIGDAGLGAMWQLQSNGATIMVLPKGVLIRSLALNHLYHHRGQLSVYLRLLNVPVPAIYGPSADENPMSAAQG